MFSGDPPWVRVSGFVLVGAGGFTWIARSAEEHQGFLRISAASANLVAFMASLEWLGPSRAFSTTLLVALVALNLTLLVLPWLWRPK